MTSTARDDSRPNRGWIDDFDARTREVLGARPSRPPNHQAESQAFIALAEQLAERPSGVLQRLAELVVELIQSGSAGISVLETDHEGQEIFRWAATAGSCAAHAAAKMARHGSPCGMVIDQDVGLLFEDPARVFPAAAGFHPAIRELILAPFHRHGRAVGAVWAISHDPARQFCAEDMRLLTSMAAFVSLKIFSSQTRSFAPTPPPSPAHLALASLTQRQRDILGRILDGQPNKVIAADLGISQRTAEAHRAAIMKKMGASSVSGLVRKALLGLEPPLADNLEPAQLRATGAATSQ